MKYIPKTLYLPSGGLPYSPVAKINRLDSAYHLMLLDINSYETRFDMIQSIIDFYCELPAPITEMYLADIYYLYTYILTTEILDDVYLTKATLCPHCGTQNNISLSAGNFDLSFINPFVPESYDNIFISTHDIHIKIRSRLVKDNLQFASLLNQSEDEYNLLKYLDTVILFLVTQIDSIIINNQDTEQRYWIDILNTMITDDILRLFSQALTLNKVFGIYDRIKYNCSECHKKNLIWYFDDILDNRVITQREIRQEDLLTLVKGMMSESRLPCFTLEDVLSRPLNLREIYNMAIQETDFKAGQVLF